MPFLEIINGIAYDFYQINGTKYYKNFKTLPDATRETLEKCAGEMFLFAIPENTTADQIAKAASLLGELYVLRFKINFAGLSRGFAYLQYMDPDLMDEAVERLPGLLRNFGLGNIRVQRSKNTSKLVIRNTASDMTTDEVRTALSELCTNYDEFNVRYLKNNKMEFQLVFGSNEDAVNARRFLLGRISVLGSDATIGWDTYSKRY